MKKTIKMLLAVVVGVVLGSVAVVLLEYFSNGGTVEELKDYLKGDVIPSAVNVITILGTIYIGSQKLRNNMSGASDGLLSATAQIGSVTQLSAATQTVVENISERLLTQIEQNDAQKAEIAAQREMINALSVKIDIMQQMVAAGFGNMPELVKSGNARMVYKIMEEGENNETEG